MKEYNNETVIVSLTSHHERLSIVPRVIFSILKGREKNVHIVLTIYKDDLKNINSDLNLLISNNMIELLIADENLKPHLKYYYAMKKYKSCPIITIDDDCIYPDDLISSLLSYYNKFKHSICARRVHEIPPKKTSYSKWKWCTNNNRLPSRHKFATGVGGVLYPPNILDIDSIDINELKSCLNADDIYLKVLENRKNIDIQIVGCKDKHPRQIELDFVTNSALSNENVIKNRNDVYIDLFSKDIF